MQVHIKINEVIQNPECLVALVKLGPFTRITARHNLSHLTTPRSWVKGNERIIRLLTGSTFNWKHSTTNSRIPFGGV